MQTAPENWAAILGGLHFWETKAVIGGNIYGEDRILSLSTSSALFAEGAVSVGGCVAGEIDLTVRQDGEIARMAEIQIYVRPVSGSAAGDWMPKGRFYIDTREYDTESGTITMHGYDAMLKMEQSYLADGADVTGWPKSTAAVMGEIAETIGVELDGRNALSTSYMVEAPVGYTMREVAGWVAAAHCGNWTVTESGTLRLIPMRAEEPDTVNAGNNALSLDTSPTLPGFTGVDLYYDDENGFSTGSRTGRVLEAYCPFATQAIVNGMLTVVNGYAYQPYEAAGVLLDPLAEMGDMVSIGGVSGMICVRDITFDHLCASDISAPYDEEVDHEYPYESKTQRELKRTVKLGQSYYGTKIDRAKGLTITKTNPLGGTETRAVLNSDELSFYDENGNKVLYFDPNTGSYKFVGDVTIKEGSININDKFVVDEQGNLEMSGSSYIYGGRYYAGSPVSDGGYTEMTSGGFRVVNALGQLKLLFGYTTSGFDYPFIELGSGDGSSGSKGLVKKFQDGLWVGNDAPKYASGMFSPQSGYNGVFVRFSDNKAYVVQGSIMMNIYTGDAIARFG